MVIFIDTLQSYFGNFNSSLNLSDSHSMVAEGDFVLPITEFKFDANLIGFEFYAHTAGSVTIRVKFILF